MVQHLVLMMVAPPLLVYGAPTLPLLRGLPHVVCKRGLGPLLAWTVLRRLERLLTHPVLGWLAFAVATVAWHVPALYELALHSHFWHHVQHLCFLSTGMLFWWPVPAALAQPTALATLGHDPLLTPRRYPEHGLIGSPGLLGAHPLSHLSHCPTPMGHLGSRRPGSRRGHNVGARFARLSCASRVAGDAAPERTTDASPGHNASCPQNRLRHSHGCRSPRAKSSPRNRMTEPSTAQCCAHALIMPGLHG